MAIDPLPDRLPPGALVVLAGDVEQVMLSAGHTRPVGSKADAADERAIVEWLRAVIQPGHKVISICSGALLAGRAGLLDGRACTTHHSCCTELAILALKPEFSKTVSMSRTATATLAPGSRQVLT
jgi:putative intracellular protease/amidase